MLDEAVEQINKALKINPGFAKAYNTRGAAYYNKGLYDRAISDYSKAIEIKPKYAEAYYNRGYTYDEKGLNDRLFLILTKPLK